MYTQQLVSTDTGFKLIITDDGGKIIFESEEYATEFSARQSVFSWMYHGK